jgi:AbrB family looped-hinge helix DNA binding protein
MTQKETFDLRAVTVSEKGQVAIPVDIRRKLNIRKGQRLILEVSGSKLLIAKSEDISRRMRDDFRHLLILSEKTADELWENEKDAIWDKL